MPHALPGAHLLEGAIDCHVHCAPHLNGRSVNVFEAVRQAAAAGMRGIGIMCNFQNSSGYAALANEELGHLGCYAFGGVIMQPTAGGVTLEVAKAAVDYGYGPGTGARFVSLPTHHTRHVAESEGRSPAFLETTFQVPPNGRVPDPVPAIMELCAAKDVVFDCGHVAGYEAVALAEEARRRGVTRLRAHGARYTEDEIRAIVGLGGYVEFSFFVLTHATQIGLTHVDEEKHRISGGATIHDFVPRIRAAGERCILSSDAGVYLLPPPVEALREFLLLAESVGFSEAEIRRMTATNPATLFGLPD
ncbi:DUF6282 family protein [Elioraea sp.]|uniref:DUF6282 family protein n=1 Tax=Elioraea sp. TaxID=2185103 RepID=UPI00307D8E08